MTDDKTLVVLIGPPAVGKMAVGRELERLTGLPLFHNHMTIELILPFFDFGTEPFNRLVGSFRRGIFEEVGASDGPGIIFTYVWAFDVPADLDYVEWLTGTFTRAGGRAVFAELTADLETRLARNGTPLRLREKPSKRDVEASNARLIEHDERFRFNSDGDFPYDDHVLIDTTTVEPAEAAERIVEAFDLRRA